MKKRSAKAVLVFRIVAFIICTGGILLHMLENRIVSSPESGFMVRHKLAYFTIQTNIWIALLFAVLIIKTVISYRREKEFSLAFINPSLQGALTLYISITMLGYWLLLSPFTGIPRNPFLFFSSLLLHGISPLLAIADYIFFVPHGSLKPKDALSWLSYPVLYLLFVMLYSKTITEPYYSFKMGDKLVELMYPYPFLDSSVMGVYGVIGAVAVLAAVFYLLGRLLIYLDGKAAKHS